MARRRSAAVRETPHRNWVPVAVHPAVDDRDPERTHVANAHHHLGTRHADLDRNSQTKASGSLLTDRSVLTKLCRSLLGADERPGKRSGWPRPRSRSHSRAPTQTLAGAAMQVGGASRRDHATPGSCSAHRASVRTSPDAGSLAVSWRISGLTAHPDTRPAGRRPDYGRTEPSS